MRNIVKTINNIIDSVKTVIWIISVKIWYAWAIKYFNGNIEDLRNACKVVWEIQYPGESDEMLEMLDFMRTTSLRELIANL